MRYLYGKGKAFKGIKPILLIPNNCSAYKKLKKDRENEANTQETRSEHTVTDEKHRENKGWVDGRVTVRKKTGATGVY